MMTIILCIYVCVCKDRYMPSVSIRCGSWLSNKRSMRSAIQIFCVSNVCVRMTRKYRFQKLLCSSTLQSIASNAFVYLLMFDQMRLLSKCFGAHFATEWLLTGMGPVLKKKKMKLLEYCINSLKMNIACDITSDEL